MLKLPVSTTIVTANIAHYYFTRKSFLDTDLRDIAMGAMFLACKSEETLRRSYQVAAVFDYVFKVIYLPIFRCTKAFAQSSNSNSTPTNTTTWNKKFSTLKIKSSLNLASKSTNFSTSPIDISVALLLLSTNTNNAMPSSSIPGLSWMTFIAQKPPSISLAKSLPLLPSSWLFKNSKSPCPINPGGSSWKPVSNKSNKSPSSQIKCMKHPTTIKSISISSPKFHKNTAKNH